jgi:hypothetical protein
MALTADEQRRCYLYLGYLQVNRTGVFVGGQPMTTEVVQKLQVSLDTVTPNGETSVRALLATLDGLYAKLGTADTRMQASVVGSVTLNPKEWSDRMQQWQFFRRQLAVTLDVALDPFTEADRGEGGLWREP